MSTRDGGLSLRMKQAVITGGNGGLASELARHLDENSWQVAAPGRDELDVCDAIAVDGYFADRPVDLLVCAAGITRDTPLVRMTEGAWDEVWRTNFEAAAACAAAALPTMISRGIGHIVFISSRSALHPPVGQAAYAASKAALLGHMRDLASSHGASGIRINAVLPGFLETAMTAGVGIARREEILADHALGRFNTPQEVAGFIRHLHDHLPHTSGQAFQLDSR